MVVQEAERWSHKFPSAVLSPQGHWRVRGESWEVLEEVLSGVFTLGLHHPVQQ